MTDLTEQWKKGELPEGFYFVNDGAKVTIDYYLCDYWERHFDIDVQQVLAPVPTFEEYQQLKEYERIVTSYNMKPIDYDIACETVNKLLDERKVLKEENSQLKELLEWCRDELFEIYSNEVSHPEDVPIIKKLDEVLK